MAQTQTGDVGSNRVIGEAVPSAVLSDEAVSFRIVVTLRCLSIPLDSRRPGVETATAFTLGERPRPTAVPVATSAPTPAIAFVVPALATVSEPSRPIAAPDVSVADVAVPAAHIDTPPPGLPWELAAPEFRLGTMVPTVLRALKKPAAEVEPSLPTVEPVTAASSTHTVSRTVEGPRANTEDSGDTQTLASAPSVPNLYTTPSGLKKSLLLKVGAGALAATAILIPVWRHFARSARDAQNEARIELPAASDAQNSIQGGDWVRQPAVGGDPGVKQSRQLVLYKPGLKVTNSRTEFAWSTDSGDVGVVFRAKDLGNYYAVRLKLRNPRTTPTLGVEYFSVYQFVESRHTEKYLELFKIDPVVRVRLDVFGPSFTLYLQDNPTDYWTDARLSSGAIGFFEEWNQSPQVTAVRMSLAERSQLFRKPMLPRAVAAQVHELEISGGE